ncbi:MAG: DUF1016 N-terminal domain-containing protein [Candidatus Berkelbacteria bacterium]|nr:DUF1016 N-terminal domain-containing protein [Candidatus Berkelbacteria bacterium]
MIEELKAILSEAHFSASIEVIKGKWELGRRIEEETKNFQRAGYGKKIVEVLSTALDMSDQTLWKCIQFYKKFPEKKFESVVGRLGDGKTPSWHKICLDILPSHREAITSSQCHHNNLLCLNCRKRFKKGEI